MRTLRVIDAEIDAAHDPGLRSWWLGYRKGVMSSSCTADCNQGRRDTAIPDLSGSWFLKRLYWLGFEAGVNHLDPYEQLRLDLRRAKEEYDALCQGGIRGYDWP